MRAAFLDDLAIVLGSREMSLDESAAAGRLRSRPSALRDAGFGRHRVAAERESAESLALAALTPLARRHPDAGALLTASTLRAEAAPSREITAHVDLDGARLLARLDLHRAFVVGIGRQACTSAIGALRVARGLLAAEPSLSPILACAADRLPGDAILEQGFSPLSDGAAACVVTTEPRGWRLVAFDAVVHGELADASDEETMGRLFPVAHALVTRLLEGAARKPSDLARLVPPNIPAPAARILARALRIPEDRATSPTLAEAGHVMSCDPLLNLAAIEREGVAAGDLVVVLAAGYGLTWQAMLLERMP